MADAIRTAVLYADYTTRLSYYDDWLDAFQQSSHYDVTPINICGKGAEEAVRKAVRDADLIVLLHSTNGDTTIYLEPFSAILAERRGKLLAFIGNEVNLPGSPIAAKRDVLARIMPDFIGTQLLLEAGEFLWGDLVRNRVVALPHALNPAAFTIRNDTADRPIDIGVRAVRYLPYLGDDDRNRLHDLFQHHDFAPDIRVDISSDRFDRDGWATFLNCCKGTVSSEAGTWFIERDDATIEAIRRWVMQRAGGRLVIANDSVLRRIGHKLPWRVRALARRVMSRGYIRHESTINEELDFDEIYQAFFAGRPIPAVHGKCISSRHFDAIGAGTCQILLEGRYNDLLQADVHYISLQKDYANIGEVMRRFGDEAERRKIISAARDHALAHHTYVHRMDEIFRIVSEASPAMRQAVNSSH